MTRYLLAWLPMVPIAVANGALREALLLPRFGEPLARQLSTVLLIALFALYIGLVFRRRPLASERQAIAVGAVWLALTLAFEFALGRFVSGLSWGEILAEYDLAAGRLWVLVPAWVALSPYVFYCLARDP